MTEIWDPLSPRSHIFSHCGGPLNRYLECWITKSFRIIFADTNEFLEVKNPTLDTKIFVLCGFMTKIWDPLSPRSHIFSHRGGPLDKYLEMG